MSITLTSSDWNKAVYFLLFSFAPLLSYGQDAATPVFEFTLNPKDDVGFAVVSTGNTGLILYRPAETATHETGIEAVRVDTALHQQWIGFVPIAAEMVVRRSAVGEKSLYLLLQNRFKPTAGYQVLDLDLATGKFELIQINNPIAFTPSEFSVTKSGIFIAGYFNYRPLVLFYSFGTDKAHILPGFLNDPGDLIQLANYPNGETDIILGVKNIKGRKSIWVRSYDAEGSLMKTIAVEPDPDKHLIFGHAIKTANGGLVLGGVYGHDGKNSQGIFVAHINAYGEYEIDYYNFSELPNFFSYLKGKKQKRIQKQIERLRSQGKSAQFNYQLLVHDLIPYKDHYVLVGEAFHPTYRYPSSPLAISHYPIFDGYIYSHAIVIGISRNGELLWDNSFEINDVKSFELKQLVKVLPGEDKITLVYLYDNILRSKVIRGFSVLTGKTEENIDPLSQPTKAPFVTNGSVEYWFGHNFYVAGVRRSADQEAWEHRLAKVFFIRKVAYP